MKISTPTLQYVGNEGDRIAALLRQTAQQQQQGPSTNDVADSMISAFANSRNPNVGGSYNAYTGTMKNKQADEEKKQQNTIASEKDIYNYMLKAKQLGDQDTAVMKDGLDTLVGKDPEKQMKIIKYVKDNHPDLEINSTNYLQPAVEAMKSLGLKNDDKIFADKKNALSLQSLQSDINYKNARAYKAISGNSGNSVAPQADNQYLSNELGVPIAPSNPYQGVTPGSVGTMKKSIMDSFNKNEPELQKSQNNINDMQRFMELNRTTHTGGENAIWGATPIRAAMDPSFSEMRSISDKIAPQMRQPGSGSSSDKDVQLFKSATVDVNKPEKANDNIATAVISREKNAIDYDQFKRDYFDVNGHIQGADRYWKEYLNANPIFDKTATEKDYKLNSNRLSYKEYFNNKKRGGQTETPYQDGAEGMKPNQSNISGGMNGQNPSMQPRQAPDGNFYLPDPNRPGKYLRVDQ